MRVSLREVASIGIAALLAFACAILPVSAFARDASTLRIAGLSVGAPVADLPHGLAKHGFSPVAQPSGAEAARGDLKADRLIRFQRRDGHTIDVSIPSTGQPLVRGLVYGLANDRDAFEQLRNHLRGLFGSPDVVHGAADIGVRVAVWEIAGTDMTIEGVLTTSITLIRDPVQGHSLAIRELRIRPQLGGVPSLSGNSGRSGSQF